VIAKRDEKGSPILTSNQPLSQCAYMVTDNQTLIAAGSSRLSGEGDLDYQEKYSEFRNPYAIRFITLLWLFVFDEERERESREIMFGSRTLTGFGHWLSVPTDPPPIPQMQALPMVAQQ
jgi:hypothetical protein